MGVVMIVDLTWAPFSVLAFIGTAFVCVIAVSALLVFQARRNAHMSRLCGTLLAGWVGLYLVAMLGVSAFSKDLVLRRGAEKHFCEVDCHLAYSVTGVETPAEVPAEFAGAGMSGPGKFLLITLRTWFDETIIGPHRGDGLLTPNNRMLYLRGGDGKLYSVPYSMAGTPLRTALRPGESYETRILFRLPPEAKNPQLFLRNDEWPNSLLIGHENSPLHGKVYFEL